MITYHSASAADTEAFARDFAARLRPNDVLAFRGGLGVGKTTFVRGLAQGLGDGSEVSSPTFAIVHEYSCTPRLCHFDMYRIVSDDDLDSIDFDGYLGRGMILTEWSENIADRLPKRYFSVIITKTGENSRDISVYYEER